MTDRNFLFAPGQDAIKITNLGIVPESGRKITSGVRYYPNPSPAVLKSLISATEYIRVTDHSVLTPTLTASWNSRFSQYTDANVMVKGRTPQVFYNSTEPTLDELKIRGYPKKGFATRLAGISSLDYDFPLLRLFRGWDVHPIFFENFYGNAFFENTFLPDIPILLPAVGTGAFLKSTLFYQLPLTVSLEYHHGLQRSFQGQGELIFSIAFGGISP